jgi:hypothetical protein
MSPQAVVEEDVDRSMPEQDAVAEVAYLLLGREIATCTFAFRASRRNSSAYSSQWAAFRDAARTAAPASAGALTIARLPFGLLPIVGVKVGSGRRSIQSTAPHGQPADSSAFARLKLRHRRTPRRRKPTFPGDVWSAAAPDRSLPAHLH